MGEQKGRRGKVKLVVRQNEQERGCVANGEGLKMVDKKK
jgi:hypothetical protein